MTLLEFFDKGGILMYFILATSIIALWVIMEKYLVLRRAKMDAGDFMLRLRSILRQGDTVGAIEYCSRLDVPIARILKRGIMKLHEGDEKIKEAIESAGKMEVYQLEKRLGLLASTAGIAPLLGFLGTVTGMINAFRTVEVLGGMATAADLAGGIWEALLTTAFGLIVGIPAYGFYNYFVSRIQHVVFEMEATSEEFLELVRAHKEILQSTELVKEGRP
ncbi:MAG: MotA/TolQ/ExbB proton channel family protein [Bacteroidota bacterium]